VTKTIKDLAMPLSGLLTANPKIGQSPIGKIIVVDDDSTFRELLLKGLSKQGFKAYGFDSGERALAELRVKEFDLLLTDLAMPGMDGLALMDAAAKIDPHLIVITMTAESAVATAVKAMKAGAFDYVIKPFSLATMIPTLTRALDARRLRMENLQLRETVAIHSLCQTISCTLDPQTLLSRLADAVLQQSDAEEVSILLPTGDGTALYVAAIRGETREHLLGERVPLDKGIASWVARELKPLVLNGEVDDKRFVALWPRPEIRSAVSVPMQVANRLVGIINLNLTKSRRAFTLGQMKALTILASTAAAALDSASLYAQVQQAERNYRSIFENAVDGIFRATPDAVSLISVNPVMARMFGYDSPAEMVASMRNLTDQLGFDRARCTTALDSLSTNGIFENFETLVRRKDGSEIWVAAKVRTVCDNDGEVEYLDGIVQDVTERKIADDILRASEAEMKTLFASIEDAIGVLDDRGHYLKIAPTNNVVFDIPGDRIGKTLHEIFPKKQADYFLAGIQKALSNGEIHRFEYSLKINNKDYWFDGSLSPLNQNTVIWIARDVTARKNAEQVRLKLATEMDAQQRRISNIVASVPGVVWEAWGRPDAAAQRIDFVSDHVEAMLGYSVEEWLSTPNFWLKIVHPADQPEAKRIAAEAFVAGSKSTQQFRWIHRDGHSVWVEANSVVIRDKEGRPAGVRGVNIDITERKHAEESLRSTARARAESLALLDVLLSSAPIGFAFLNLDLVYERINESLAAINGLTVEQHLGHTLRDVVPKMADQIEPFLLRVLDAGLPVTDVLLHGETRGDVGHEHQWLSSFYPVQLPGGELLGVGLLVTDVTSRRRAEELLRDSEERYRELVENAHDIIYTHDLRGKYTSMNDAGQQITGYTLAEAIDLDFAETVTPECIDKAREMLKRKLAGEKSTAYELEIIVKDGKRLPLEVNTRLMFKNGVPVGVQGIARDISQRKLLESQLRQSQKMEAIGQLAGGVAHDFNNLLTVINGYSSLALQHINDAKLIKGYIEEVLKGGDRAANLTRQLLAFGRKQILKAVPIKLNAILTDMTAMLRRLIGEDIELREYLDPTLKQIMADPGQVEQILVNLVVNAQDSMPHGGVLTIETLGVAVDQGDSEKHLAMKPGSYVMLAVSDTGSGMNDETREKVFEPFFTTKEKGKGTGLGLSTVYGIVKQTGGGILVNSEIGVGTTFEVYFPQVETSIQNKEPPVVEPHRLLGSETILLVEDEAAVRELAQKILLQFEYEVLCAEDGAAGIRMSDEYPAPIHLLLTDVVMPKMSGKEVAEHLKISRPNTRVLFMSGYTDRVFDQHGDLAQAGEFIQKPFSPTSLAQKVRSVLDREGVDQGNL
jgi:two-component system cell cycle sensor histidine kinase/response regulator CckA